MEPVDQGLHNAATNTAWLADRAEALAAAGRTRQRELQEHFEQRRREDIASGRMLVFCILFVFASALFLVATLLPMAWDALHHYWQASHSSAAGLLAVVAAPRLPARAAVVICRYCKADIPVVGPPQPLTESLVEAHSEGCHCRMTTRVLKGLLVGNPVALLTFETFRQRWYVGLGVSPQQAQDNARLLCRVPLPEHFAEAVAAELERRSDVVCGKRED